MQLSYILYRGRNAGRNHVMTLYDVIRQFMSVFHLNVVSASISPLQDVRELHALSLPLAGRYTLGIDYFVD